MKETFDAIVIGAGVVGSAIARELSRYQLKTAVLEKNLDVCNETSGRNSAVVHGGFAYDTGTLKARFCVAGNQMMEQLSKELDFPFIRCGKVLVGNTDEDMAQLKRTMDQGAKNGAAGLELIDTDKLHQLVPAVVGKFAMWSKTSGILDPFLFTVGLAENAHANGVSFYFDREVTGISRETGEDGKTHSHYVLDTPHGQFKARWVINAAGLGCKKISDMLGIAGYRVIGSKGHYIILKKELGALLPMPVYPVPSNTYMGIHVTPTVDGNVTVGPDADTVDEFSYYGVPQANMDYLAESAKSLWPHIRKEDQNRNFSGILPKWVDENGVIQDFKIEIKDDIAPNAVNLVGIESPGLTGAVPIAQYADAGAGGFSGKSPVQPCAQRHYPVCRLHPQGTGCLDCRKPGLQRYYLPVRGNYPGRAFSRHPQSFRRNHHDGLKVPHQSHDGRMPGRVLPDEDRTAFGAGAGDIGKGRVLQPQRLLAFSRKAAGRTGIIKTVHQSIVQTLSGDRKFGGMKWRKKMW